MTVSKQSSPLCGEISLPGDKSLAHRALLFSALAEGDSEISNFPASGVSRAMSGALESLGAQIEIKPSGVAKVRGGGMKPFPRQGATAFCGNSATTIRMLAGALAATGTGARLDGSEGLRRRPMARIAGPLSAMGVDIACANGGTAPLDIAPRPSGKRLSPFRGGTDVASAQVKSCIILAALAADGESEITEPSLSRDHTERMLSAMGAKISRSPGPHGPAVKVSPLESPLSPVRTALPGDISSAAFLFAAAAIVPGSRVCVRGLCLNPGRTGFLECLAAMGAEVEISPRGEVLGEPAGDVTVRAAALHGIDVRGDLVVRTIDEFPALAAVAAFAEGATTVAGAAELRTKESDRIAAITRCLRAIGADVEEYPDGFCIAGGGAIGGETQAGGDHRLAMAMAVAGLGTPHGVTVRGADILAESYPSFAADLAALKVEGLKVS